MSTGSIPLEPETARRGSAVRRGRGARLVVNVLLALVCGGFGLVVVSHAASTGLCCADDGYSAIAAKNLALGYGYSSSVNLLGNEGVTPFDPAITTGPVLLLPAALAIKALGNAPWVPGMVTSLVALAVLAGLTLTLRTRFGTTRALAYTALLLSLCYLATAGPYFTQWYALLGEVPAACLVLAGIATLVLWPTSGRAGAVGGLLLGLAVATKTLALVSVLPVVAYVALRVVLAARPTRPTAARVLLWTVVAAVVPSALFEVWKIAVLGLNRYPGYVADWWAFFRYVSGGQQQANIGQAPPSVADKLASFGTYYGFSVYALLALLVLTLVTLYLSRSSGSPAFEIAVVAAIGSVANLAWFVLLSSADDARYTLIGTILGLAALSALALGTRRVWARALVTVLVAVVLLPPVARLRAPLAETWHNGFAQSQRETNLTSTAQWLDVHRESGPFIGTWWATMVDLEYALPGADNFESLSSVGSTDLRGRYLAVNRTWADLLPSPEFSALAARCNEVVVDADPYVVTRCH